MYFSVTKKKSKFADSMNIPFHILNFLKTNNKVIVDGFGVFYLKNTGAIIREEGKILPPAKEIAFEVDHEIRNKDLIRYISEEENKPEIDVEIELKKNTTHWKNLLDNTTEVQLDHIGKFWNENDVLHFRGNRVEELSPDFYGLEEINLSEIKSVEQPNEELIEEEEEGSYKFNNSILWIFLIVVPVAGLLYFGITNQELIFGKKSMKDAPIKTSTKRIPEAPKDSLGMKKADSLKIDSAAVKAVSSAQ